MQRVTRVGIIIIFLCAVCAALRAQWNLNPSVRNAIAVTDSQQRHPAICPDGKGGAIIAWDDNRIDSTHTFIYAQRIDRYGYTKWQTNGVFIIQRFEGLQNHPALASDGAGGAFIAWYDDSAGHNLYYDHLDSMGNVTWSPGTGVLLEHDSSAYATPILLVGIFNDGQHGAIFLWDRRHFGPARDSIFFKHVDQNGNVVIPATLVNHFALPVGNISASADANGNLFFGITVAPATGGIRGYVQKYDQNGSPQWQMPGVSVTDTVAHVLQIYIVADQQGGVFVAWNQTKPVGGGKFHFDGYVADVNSIGTKTWQTPDDSNSIPAFASDDAGGVLITRLNQARRDTLYAQRITPAGTQLWNGGTGAALFPVDSVVAASQQFLCSDSAGGAFVAWTDAAGANMYAAHVDANGNLFWNPVKTICNAARGRSNLVVVQGDANELIATWQDSRDTAATENDIYAAKLGDPDLTLEDSILDFGRVNVGDTVTITKGGLIFNNGVEILGIDRMNLVGANVNQFTIVNDTTFDTLLYEQRRDGIFSFHPNALGTDAADVVFTSNTKFRSPVYHLRGRGVAPAITVIPGLIDFGKVSVGQFRDSIVTKVIRNTGSGFLHIDSLIVSGGGGQFTIDSGNVAPVVLDSGQALTLKLRFTPSAAKASNAVLYTYGNIPAPGRATLVGTGVRGAMNAAAFVIDFGSVAVGAPSDSIIPDLVRDTGSGALNVLQTLLAGGDSSQFSVKSGGAPFALAPAKGEQMTLEFLPTGVGEKQTTFILTSDVPDTLRITLRGNGITQQGKRNAILALSAPKIIFADTIVGAREDSTLTAWIKNTGDTTLTVTSMSLAGANASEFSVDDSTTAFSLDSGATQTITVHFTPQSPGTKTAQIQFASNSAATQTLFLQGSAHASSGALAVAANLIDFGNVPVASPRSITESKFVHNSGNGSLNISRMNITGANASDFSVTSSAAFTLPVGGSADLTVQFIPAAAGARTALLTIYTDTNDSAQITLQGIGVNRSQRIAASSYTIDMGKVGVGLTRDSLLAQFIKNIDTASVTITSVTFSGPDAAAFAVPSPAFPSSIAAQRALDVTIGFTPIHIGVHNATATFVTDAGDSLQVAFTGAGIGTVEFSIGSAHGVPGAQVTVPITITPVASAMNMRQITLQVQYDPFQFYPVGVSVAGTAAAQWAFTPLAIANGTVTINGIGAQPLAAESLFVNLQGDILANSVMQSPISIISANEMGDTDITLGVNRHGTITTDSLCGYSGTSFSSSTSNIILYYPAPNPTQDATLLQYWLPSSGNASITLCDANGNIVYTKTELGVNRGLHQATIDASAYRSGTYMMRLSFNGESVTRKIVVQR